MALRPKIPAGLTSDPAAAYRLGFRDGHHHARASAGRKGGSVSSEKKAAAARANAKLPRPRKKKDATDA